MWRYERILYLALIALVMWGMRVGSRQESLTDMHIDATNDLGDGGALRAIVNQYRPELRPFEEVYRDIHQHPELGRQEKRTSSIASQHLRSTGYEVFDSIGGHGVVGVLRNGKGPIIMLRADMDALPIKEDTGLPYASKIESVDTDGEKKPVMHACGHDMHVTAMLATASLLSEAQSKWKGTLLVLFQPDEEHGAGARAMLDDGLYKRIPKPQVVLGQHISPIKAGSVRVRPGVFMASADTFKVTVYGKGAHGARPQDAIDPIVLAASIVMRIQTIVSREIAPSDVASITCASIHGGKAHNVIPDEVELLLNVRTFDTDVRDKVNAAIKRIIRGEAIAAGVRTEPTVDLVNTYPLTVNDPASAEHVARIFKAYFGDNFLHAPQLVASEDFSLLATNISVPSVFWNFGSVDKDTWEKYERTKDPDLIPQTHQAKFAPTIEPTLKTAVDAMSLVALGFLDIVGDDESASELGE